MGQNVFNVAEGEKIGVPQMTRGGSTHSGFRIASTIVLLREKNSYANIRSFVHLCNHTALTCFSGAAAVQSLASREPPGTSTT